MRMPSTDPSRPSRSIGVWRGRARSGPAPGCGERPPRRSYCSGQGLYRACDAAPRKERLPAGDLSTHCRQHQEHTTKGVAAAGAARAAGPSRPAVAWPHSFLWLLRTRRKDAQRVVARHEEHETPATITIRSATEITNPTPAVKRSLDRAKQVGAGPSRPLTPLTAPIDRLDTRGISSIVNSCY